MPTLSPSGGSPLRGLALAVLLAGLTAGCQALGGGGGVMPASDVGLPPSMRDALPNRQTRAASVDADGQPVQTAPTRQIVLPKTAGAGTRTAEAGERRIRREDLEGEGGGRGGGGAVGPMLSPGGSVGLGGKF